MSSFEDGLVPLSRSDLRKMTRASDGKNRIGITLGFDSFAMGLENLTAVIGLEPNVARLAGETYLTAHGLEKASKSSVWEVETKYSTNDYLGDVFKEYMQQVVAPRAERVRKIALQSQCYLTVVQYYYQSNNPGFHLDKDDIDLLSSIHAEIDCDLYCLYSEQE